MADAEHSKCFSERSAGSSPAFGTMTNPTLVFDGDCGFCTSAANLVVAKSKTPVTAVAWQLTDLTPLGLNSARASERVWLVIGDTRFGGHRAFAKLLMLQRNALLGALGRLLLLPPFSWFAAVGYRLVARYRHWLPGGTPACKLPR
jgi:predicted DCC family thiol-disulfide oxidoreductase YuxK